MDPGYAPRSGRILNNLDIDPTEFATADKDVIPVFIGKAQIGDLWDLSEQAGAQRLDQRKLIAEPAVM